jgi:hypothetical protein
MKAEVTRILEIAGLTFFSFPGGMAIVVHMLEIVWTLPEADIVNDQFKVTFHCLSDGFKGFKFTIDMLIDDDFLNPHILVLKGLSDSIDPGCGRDFDVEAGKPLPYKVD